ncbi:MAG: hypothetical protein LBN38_03320 [Verrucomicrobiota bacterium]|jgi:hypothetical protein|nr:hypothetical protein [Verrucomicrobiota bacterium]
MGDSNSKLERWEAKLKTVFDEIDKELEGTKESTPLRLHPNRPPAGSTSNREDDGLFDLGAAFTVGIGSKYGPGYVVQARMATLEQIPPEEQKKFEQAVIQRLRQKLPKAFPNTKLRVDLDGHIYKIHGDLSLGRL